MYKMSDMKHYQGIYSYSGKFKQQKNGSKVLDVDEFTYEGKYFKPSNKLVFIITPRPEEGGWLSVKCDAIGVIIGGNDLEEALGNAFMDAALQYEDLMYSNIPLTEHAQKIKDLFRNWTVHTIDQQAQ